jgi:hypothetical protein
MKVSLLIKLLLHKTLVAANPVGPIISPQGSKANHNGSGYPQFVCTLVAQGK